MRILLTLFTSGVCLCTLNANAATIFSDDFESGNMNNWTQTPAAAGTSLVNDAAQNIVPAGGSRIAKMDSSADRMHRNIIADNGGIELGGYSTFTSYIYDAEGTTATRIFNEVRGYSGTGLPNGGSTADGTLGQLLAIGKYNTVTKAGEVYNGTKYQARVTFGTDAGWFNLDGPLSPNRSPGWHKFMIERLADGTSLNFYVDDILSETFLGAAASTWDSVVIGPGLGTTAGDAWIDGVRIATDPIIIPEPSTVALVACSLMAIGIASRRRDG